jgi:hypothetical protein
MKPSVAIKDKEPEIRKIIESYGFCNPRIFGSTAKNTDKEGSDLDILVSISDSKRKRISLFTISDLEDQLEKTLGVKVDINIDRNIPKFIEKDIEENSFSL